MPWCDACSKFWNPNSMPPDGTCPTCGRLIGEPLDTSVPWHFWLLAAATVLYLGWRAVQGLQWLTGKGYSLLAVALGVAAVVMMVGAIVWFVRNRDHRTEGGGYTNDR